MARMARDLAVILAFMGAGRLLAGLLPFSFPGSIIGMLLLFCALAAGWARLEWVQDGAGLLLKHMAVMFVPVAVGLVGYLGLLERNATAFAVSTLLSTFVTMAVVGLAYQRMRS